MHALKNPTPRPLIPYEPQSEARKKRKERERRMGNRTTPGRDEGAMPGDWKEQAACKGETYEIFFVPQGGNHYGLAKSICGRCPVREECLEHALEHKEDAGVWGGLTEDERRALRNRRRRR